MAKKSWLYLLLKPRFLRWLIGTAGAWFLLDIAYYGTTISSPLVLKSLNPHANLVTNMVYTLIIFVVAAFPGYIVSIFTMPVVFTTAAMSGAAMSGATPLLRSAAPSVDSRSRPS